MKIVFASNFYNHHQAPFSEAMFKLLGDDYTFIMTTPVPEQRKNLGYHFGDEPNFVKKTYRSKEEYLECQKIINEADVVICGSAPAVLIKQRLIDKKLVLRYSERIYKNFKTKLQLPLRTLKYLTYNHLSNNVYMLCASAYTSCDYALSLTYINKCYKWGYFPEVKRYDDIDKLIDDKKQHSILWCARFIDLKHPEIPLLVAKKLKAEGYKFTLNLIGSGALMQNIIEQIFAYGLDDCVTMLGAMSPEKVREYMEQSEIFMFTSDFNEGWGAVLNESMNSACAVVTSHAIGATPYLVNDKVNGLIYKNGDLDDCYNKVKFLLDNSTERKQIAKKAYETMLTTWNAENAANRLLALCEELLSDNKHPNLFESGPCSKAEILKNDWYK